MIDWFDNYRSIPKIYWSDIVEVKRVYVPQWYQAPMDIFQIIKRRLFAKQPRLVSVGLLYSAKEYKTIVCSRWGGRHTRVNNSHILQAMKSIKLLMNSPPLSESNHTSKSFLSFREVIVPRISTEFNGHTNCHKNAMIITSRTKFAHVNY